jgi:myo-inositol-1(or 4)-monophosphatase
MEYHKLLEAATTAAQAGGEVLMSLAHRRGQLQVAAKAEFDFVTEADRAAEEKIVSTILAIFPEHRILAEERSSHPGSAEAEPEDHAPQDRMQWIIDPLDGTTNYIHGVPHFAISIAAKKGDEVIVGVVWDPVRRELFSAIAGGGAFLNGEPIRVSDHARLHDSLLATGFPFRAKSLIASYLQMFQSFFSAVRDIRRIGSAALDLAYVAAGRFDGFWEYGLNPWDFAAGCLLVREAGGFCSGFQPEENFWTTGNILASNGKLHQPMREIILAAEAKYYP